MIRTRKTCRGCGSAALQPVVSLGEQHLASNFVISADFPPIERKLPLDGSEQRAFIHHHHFGCIRHRQ